MGIVHLSRGVAAAVLIGLLFFPGCGGKDGSSNDLPGTPEASGPISEFTPPQQGQEFALRALPVGGSLAVPMNLQTVDISIRMDTEARSAVSNAVITFSTFYTGKPYFLIGPSILAASLDGRAVTITKEQDPVNLNQVALLSQVIPPGTVHTLEITYSVAPEDVSYRQTGIGFVTAMADISDENFFERYGPLNFEFDQYRMSVTIGVVGASSDYQLFTNGTAQSLDKNSWRIEFPSYITASSFYIHVTDTSLAVRKTAYRTTDG